MANSTRSYFFLFLLSFALILVRSQSEAGVLRLHPLVMVELNKTIHFVDPVHQALVRQDDVELERGVRDLVIQIDRTMSMASLAKVHERVHLVRILESLKVHLHRLVEPGRYEADPSYQQRAPASVAERRKESIKLAFDQLANLVRAYKVDSDFGIFFCAKDKGSWVQKGLRAKNPIHPESYLDCGIRIREK